MTTEPRRWDAPPEPDYTVSRVEDRAGEPWERVDGLGGKNWQNLRGWPIRQFTWSDLFWNHGPLTEVMLP
jgi:hypothetical protein